MICESLLMEGTRLNPVIVKIGGSVITDKSRKFSIKEKILNRVARELSVIDKNFILVHGGGSFGHPVAFEYEINSGYQDKGQIIGYSKTHQAMERLNSRVIDALISADIPAVAMQTSACTVVENNEIVSMELRNIKKILELGISPTLYGDCVPDLERGMTILSGDQIVAFLAEKLEADKVILGTDIDGVFTGNPKEDKNAELIPKITPENWKKISSHIDFSYSNDVTGGMENKVEALLDLAKKGISSKIVNATKPGILKEAIRTDKKVGTIIKER